jgi:hypothetical protein
LRAAARCSGCCMRTAWVCTNEPAGVPEALDRTDAAHTAAQRSKGAAKAKQLQVATIEQRRSGLIAGFAARRRCPSAC